jgi:hypothetical protein
MNKVYKHAVLISSASSVPENLSYSAVEEATQLAEEHLSAAEPRSASLSPPETFRTRGLPRLDRLLHRPPPSQIDGSGRGTPQTAWGMAFVRLNPLGRCAY